MDVDIVQGETGEVFDTSFECVGQAGAVGWWCYFLFWRGLGNALSGTVPLPHVVGLLSDMSEWSRVSLSWVNGHASHCVSEAACMLKAGLTVRGNSNG